MSKINQPKIFSFFSKSPQVKAQKQVQPIEDLPTSLKLNGKEIGEYDLVWAKLEGYPWWPAIVCKNPNGNSFIRSRKIHVQFFDDPVTRGWVKDSYIKLYGAPAKCGIPYNKDPELAKAREAATSVEAIPKNERQDVIVCDADSDESVNNVSDDLNDSDKSKENVEVNGTANGKRSPEASENEPKPKKRRIVIESDSEASGDEYKPENTNEDDSSSASSGVDENEVSDIEVDESLERSPTPKKAEKKRKNVFTSTPAPKKNISFTPMSSKSVNSSLNNSSLNTSVSTLTKSKLASFAKETPSKQSSPSDDFPHTKLSWLKPENIMDKHKRKKDHPDYNPRTLYVPPDFLNSQTPGLRQWWILKSDHFDTVLFFKMGKFYELFHMDAILSIEELGLLMMKGENAHTGFPEISYGRFSSVLIEKGYKVARIEQTETPAMMEERVKKAGKVSKYEKVVSREVCQVTSKGTRLPSVINGDIVTSESVYLLSITEKSIGEAGENRKMGVAFVDTSIGTFHIGQFEDDRHISRLRTLVSHHPPAQIIFDRGHISLKTLQLIKATVPPTLQESLLHDTEFWNSGKTLQFLADSKYFENDAKLEWPAIFKDLTHEGDFLGLTASGEYDLGVSALGGLIFYLRSCFLDDDLLTRKSFKIFSPPDSNIEKIAKKPQLNHHMILDGTTLQNLEIFENSFGNVEGTLFERLNSCSTAFGKRLLHCWLCSPLCNTEAIDDRLDAIDDLKNEPELMNSVPSIMKKLPDLEKLLSKIHSQSLKRPHSHPDSRAVMFEEQQYSKRKVIDFLSVVDGFKEMRFLIRLFEGKSFSSKLLTSVSSLIENGGKFPNLDEVLAFFDNAFDHENAKKEGKIIPSSGVDPEYDNSVAKIKETDDELKEYLKEQCSYFGAKVTYFGTEKRRYQLEVTEHNAKKAGSEYECSSQRKGYKRFNTPRTKELLIQMINAEDMKKNALRDIARRIFQQFDEHVSEWKAAVDCVAVLDVLMSYTRYAQQNESVRPELSFEEKPFIDIRNGRHPCSIKIFSGGDFIPNDVVIGCSSEESHQPLVMITGPNMGGKSTIMRQTALIAIMSQIGCYVPASECRLSPVDRVFTRLGAWDRIYKGESTFYVEMAETSSIIQHATPHSLVIVDELGRGTATYDGTAIAFSVVNALKNIGCRTLFSTHYHSLVKDFTDVAGVSQGHMECLVENENEEDSSKETITFLYTFAKGDCPKSYGFNVAKLADLPESLLLNARQKSKKLERNNLIKSTFSSLFTSKLSVEDVTTSIMELKKISLF